MHLAYKSRLKHAQRKRRPRTSPGDVTSACHYEHACMHTHAGKYQLTQVAALRVHAEYAVLYRWQERPPSG